MTLEKIIKTQTEELEEEAGSDMATLEHALICTNLSGELRTFVKAEQLGRVFDSSAEYRFLDEIDETRGRRRPGKQPDLSFVRQVRLPVRLRSYPNIAPDFVVEVVSSTDKAQDIEAKIVKYQQAGVTLIWVIHPFSRRVEAYQLQNGTNPQSFAGDQTELDCGELIPGFRVRLDTIFDFPPDPDPLPDLM